MEQISLLRLFLLFLKIGATAFGGNIALVAVVRKELVEKRKLLTDEQVLDFTTLGNLLPGPLATNVITVCGYTIRGMMGAVLALLGVLLPSFVLVCALAWAYFRYGESPVVAEVFDGLLPGVAAVIAGTAWSLMKKNIKQPLQAVILPLAAMVILLFKGFFVTLLTILVSALLGYLFFRKKEGEDHVVPVHHKRNPVPMLSMLAIVLTGLVIWLIHPNPLFLQELRMLSLTFGTMSVTLFGGGYVFIPAIEKAVVGMHHWVTSKEFADGIAMGQITPGPVSISAAFIGWKVAGFWGALVSTLSIFVPPAFLMLPAQQFIDRIKGRPAVEAVFKGVRPAVIGMIIASIWVIGKSAPQDWQSIVIFLVVLTLSVWKNMDTILLIGIAGVMGWVLHLI